MCFFYLILWIFVTALIAAGFGYLLTFLGIVKSGIDFVEDPIVMIASGVLSAVFLIIASQIQIGGGDPFKKKLKNVKRKSEYIKVNHNRYLNRALKQELTYLGYDRMNRFPVTIDDTIRNRHIHVIGSTGSGKSVLLFNMFLQDVSRGGSVILIDAKGDIENLDRVKQIVKIAGREKDLLFFTLQGDCNTYNPLVNGNATQLKDKIISSIVWSEVYYQRVCENLLQLLFSSINEVITLKQLYEILLEPTNIYKYGKTEASKEFINFANAHKKEKTTLTAEIGLMVFSDFYKKLNTTTPDINFFDAVKNRKIIYIGIDVQSYQETSKRLGRMITEDINTTSGIIQTQIPDAERKITSIIIDEFQAFGTENFVNCLSRGRSSGFMITIAHQSLADLEVIRVGFSRQVIDNTYTKIVLPVQDPETIQTIADIIGTYKDYEHTKEVVYSGEPLRTEKGSVKLIDEYYIHPNDIRQLKIGEAVYKCGQAAGIIQIPMIATES